MFLVLVNVLKAIIFLYGWELGNLKVYCEIVEFLLILVLIVWKVEECRGEVGLVKKDELCIVYL